MKYKQFMLFLMLLLTVSILFQANHAYAVGNVSLFTPYTGLSVTPGETISYSVDVMNDGTSIENVTFSLDDLQEDWSYTITANGHDIRQLSVRPDSEEQLNVEIAVPLQVEKADYRFNLVAEGQDSSAELPFLVTVSEEGTFKTEFESDQPNLEGHSGSTFSYSATLQNRTADTQNYALQSGAPNGWGVQFKSGGDAVTSVPLEANESKDLTIEITAPERVEAGTYEIPIRASAGNSQTDLALEAVITGSYEMQLTTPAGNLSTDITSGREKTIDLVVENTGSSPLTNVSLSSTAPGNWGIEFDTTTISEIEAGASQTVKATISAPKEAIAGDYVAGFTADTEETSAEATYRVSVKTSTLWGFVGVFIILAVLCGLIVLFRKYGRR